MSTSTEKANMKAVYDYVKYNKDRLPDYWHGKSISACIDGICCMIARGKYSDEAIAEFYECPVPLVKQIKIAYKKTVDIMAKQLTETTEMFGEGCFDNKFEKLNDDGCVRLVCSIFARCNYEN